MYNVKRTVEEDPLVGHTVHIIEHMGELETYVEHIAQDLVIKYASGLNAQHVMAGFTIRMERLCDMSGLKVAFEYRQVPGVSTPINYNAHVFKDPAASATFIRVYGEHEDTSKQIAERMGAIGKPIHRKPYPGTSIDYVVKELDDLARRFVKDSDNASVKHMGRPVTYTKPKQAPPTDRGNFKGYKKWER